MESKATVTEVFEIIKQCRADLKNEIVGTTNIDNIVNARVINLKNYFADNEITTEIYFQINGTEVRVKVVKKQAIYQDILKVIVDEIVEKSKDQIYKQLNELAKQPFKQ